MNAERELEGDTLPVIFDSSVVNEIPELVKVLSGLARTITKTGISKIKEDEIKCRIGSVKEKHIQYMKNQRLLSLVKETVCENNSIPSVPAKEIQEIILRGELSNYCNLNMDSEDRFDQERTVLFGLSELDISKHGLSYNEHSSLKVALKEKLNRTSYEEEDILSLDKLQCYQDPTTSSVPSTEIYRGKLEMFALNAELDKRVLLYNEALSKYTNLLEEAVNVRFTFIKDIFLESGQLVMERAKLFKLNAEALKCQLLILFFSEEKNVCEAVNKINDIMDSEVSRMNQEIVELRERESAYNSLQGTRFYKILEDYQAIQASIKNKSEMMQRFFDEST